MHFILDEKKKPKEVDMIEWAVWMESGNNQLKKTKVNGVLVSTVFLGLSLFEDNSDLFETMTFNGPEEIQIRSNTYQEAIETHDQLVEDLTRQSEDLAGQLNNEQVSEVRPQTNTET